MSGPARPKKVLLFGKTGDGKSTVANMLSTGDLTGEFSAGNSLVAVTKGTKEVTDPELKWTIIDTEGMFATDRSGEDQTRARELRNSLAEKYLEIDIFCYVKKASRFTRADEQCWKAFNTLLADTSYNHGNILLVFTSCNEGPGWVEQYQSILDQHMPGQGGAPHQKVGVDFPPRSDNNEIEKELKEYRAASLKLLKDKLEGSGVKGPVQLHKLHDPSRIKKITGFLQGHAHGSHSKS